MHSTGIVPSRPATACDMSRSSWIDGMSGPMPTSCGRSASAARKSAARSAPASIHDGLVERALARLHQAEELAGAEALEVLARTVLLEGGLVAYCS